MNPPRCRTLICGLILAFAGASARAQWAVIDAPAIAQLIQEVQALQQQIELSKAQLQSAQQTFRSITGDRGMALLLSGTSRNYLPGNWGQVSALASGAASGGYAQLAGEVRAAISANAVLPAQRLREYSPDEQRLIESTRHWIAVEQVIAQAALARSSDRFASLQTLVSAISSARDEKAALDLQARIGVELAMLENEQIKLHMLEAATGAQRDLLHAQASEYAMLLQGRFEDRFRPSLH